MTLRKTKKAGQYVDDTTGRKYDIYDVYPRVLTVRTGPDGVLLRPFKGEEYKLLSFGCAAAPIDVEGDLVVEVNQLLAYEIPIRVLRDVHERLQKAAPLREAGQEIEKAVARLREQDASRPREFRDAARAVSNALEAATESWVAYVTYVNANSEKNTTLTQLLTADHDCRIFHRHPEDRFVDLEPIAIDVYMHVRRLG